MKKSWILALCLVLCGGVVCAQTPSLTDYFLTNSYQRNRLNPALMPQNGYVHIPGIGSVSAGMMGNMDMAKFLNAGQFGNAKNNRLNLNADVSLFSSGWYEGNSFWTTEIAAHTLTDVRYWDLTQDGAKSWSYSSRAWVSYEVGHARAITPEWNVGGKAKFLWGLRDKMYNAADPTNAYGSLYGVLQYNNDTAAGGPIMAENWGNGGYGAAFDLGVEYRPDDVPGLRVSLAFTDLGFVVYGKGAGRQYAAVDNAFDIHNNFILTDDNSLSSSPADKGVTRATFARMNVGAEYEFYKGEKGGTISAGLLSSTYLNWKSPMTELTASVNFQPLHWFSFALGYSMIQTQQSIGLALNLTPRRGFNLLLATTYLPFGLKGVNIPQGAIAIPMSNISIPMPTKGSNFQVSVGVTVPIRLNYLVPERNSWYEAYLIEHGLYTDEYREAQNRREEKERQRDRYREEDNQRQNDSRRDDSRRDDQSDRNRDNRSESRNDQSQPARADEQRQNNDADRNRDNNSDRNRTSEQGQNTQRQESQRSSEQRQNTTTTEVRRETTTEVRRENTTNVERQNTTTTNVQRENTTDVERRNTTNVERQNTTTTNVQRETVTQQGSTTTQVQGSATQQGAVSTTTQQGATETVAPAQGQTTTPAAATPATPAAASTTATPATTTAVAPAMVPTTTTVAADSAATTAPVMPVTPVVATDSSALVPPVMPVADTTSAVGVQGVQVK